MSTRCRSAFSTTCAQRNTPRGTRSPTSPWRYDLTDEERKVVETLDVGNLFAMGTHPLAINSLCRSMGYRRADYRPLLAGSAAAEPGRTRWRKS